jgi:hypothetical protein
MLKGGFLRIEGKSKFAFSLNEGYSMQGNNQNQEGLHCVVNGSVEQIGWITFDTPLCTDCAPPGEPTLVLVLCCLPQNLNPDQNLYTVGLALQIINQSKGECVRVGLVRRIKTEWWTDAEKLLLTIL